MHAQELHAHTGVGKPNNPNTTQKPKTQQQPQPKITLKASAAVSMSLGSSSRAPVHGCLPWSFRRRRRQTAAASAGRRAPLASLGQQLQLAEPVGTAASAKHSGAKGCEGVTKCACRPAPSADRKPGRHEAPNAPGHACGVLPRSLRSKGTLPRICGTVCVGRHCRADGEPEAHRSPWRGQAYP